ncbi:UNVERIFIED_CONTAM: NAD-dependent epimerase/dehydratase family protein, partial [Microbacterium sp. SLM126]
DVGTRILRELATRMRVFAVTSQPARRAELREAGAVPLVADLDRPATLARLSRLADRVINLAPPPGLGEGDPRTRALLAALRRTAWRRARTARFGPGPGEAAILPERGWHRAFEASARHRANGAFVYASTTGVYGDRGGARVQEFHAVRPQTARARRRVAAESAVRAFGRDAGWRASIVRIPGIYADDRLPVARLHKRTPALAPQDDVYTSHIHADDLARACVHVMNLPSQTYRQHVGAAGFLNVGTDEEVSIRDLALLVAKVVGFEGSIRFDTSRPDGTPRKRLDSSVINGTGWRPLVALESGLQIAYQDAMSSGRLSRDIKPHAVETHA